jgi:hypothetical protein
MLFRYILVASHLLSVKGKRHGLSGYPENRLTLERKRYGFRRQTAS